MIRLLDISRLVENLHFAAPTGIERVEIAYAQHFLRHAGHEQLRFVVTWPHATGILDRGAAEPLIAHAAARWSATDGLARDAGFARLRDMLSAPIRQGDARGPQRIAAAREHRGADDWFRFIAIWLRSRINPVARHIGELRRSGACYVNVSQFRLNRPRRFAWLAEAGAGSLFMLHDLIPIMHPEYCRPGEADRHRARLATMLRHASAIVANSHTTRSALTSHVGAIGCPMPPCEVVPLGSPPNFARAQRAASMQGALPYFVVVGTIEPRKNLLYLLTLWHRWTQAGTAARARLVIVGRRGWENENIVDLLERSVGLAPSVIEVNALSDAGMASLLKGAAALIAPSFVEGYGLPIAEALCLGVPVLASDIEAHREVGAQFAEYFNPLDGKAWMSALDDYCEPGSARRQAAIARLADYRAVSWEAHMARIEEIAEAVAAARRN